MIRIENLYKNYDKVCALNNFSMQVRKNELFGLVGANGAGKSTLLKSIVGLVKPDQGRIYIDELDNSIYPLKVRQKIGYAPEEPTLYDYLTGYEFLQFVGRIRDIAKEPLHHQIESLLHDFNLFEKSKTLIAEYSHGMRKKISLAAALLGNPPVLLLDEPTNGLDPENVYKFKKRLLDASANGVTIIFSSHILDTVEKICHRVGIIHYGKLLASDTVANLIAAAPHNRSLEEYYMNLIGLIEPQG
jgi:ABC-2 type transport system ATP-binding protein